MKKVQKDVKLKKETVAVLDIDQFENIAEAVESLGEAKCVGLINRQYIADLANTERGKHRESAPGKAKRFQTGVNCLATVIFDDGQTGIEKLTAISVRFPTDANARIKALNDLVNSPEVQAAVDEILGVASE